MTINDGAPRRARPSNDGQPKLDAESASSQQANHVGHGTHRLMMIVCCIPMLVIATLLVVTGVAGSGAILIALACTAMMAAMMFSMPGGHGR